MSSVGYSPRVKELLTLVIAAAQHMVRNDKSGL